MIRMINKFLLWVYTHTGQFSIGQMEELEETEDMIDNPELTLPLIREIIGR